MSALAAIAVFPVLTLILIGLAKADSWLSRPSPLTGGRAPADPPPVDESSAD